MVSRIPPPDPRILLPPLLACLPTAFVSPRPPPALLPLLSPILRQRVNLLSTSATGSDSWLQLLCWDAQRASKLPQIVENVQLEPHPVSGEIEVEDVEDAKFRRLDEETLQVRLESEDTGLCFLFLWCTGDEQTGDGWRLSELRALEDGEDGSTWYESISEADESAGARPSGRVSLSTNGTNGTSAAPASAPNRTGSADDDDYWAMYDQTPGRTPAKRSPAPATSSVPMPSNSELEYFARYMAEVQPAMDPHDPSEEGLPPGESTLNGNETTRSLARPRGAHEPRETSIPLAPTNGTYDGSTIGEGEERKEPQIEHPRPSSSSSNRSVEKLEQNAETQSQAEVAIKQHISTDLKSLFRLARSTGIQRDEFERIVKTELECLGMMDSDE
ncbi:hypothetical protein NA57DRAFT_55534 [Rhizodiscina lignyota]|uniref:Uncharacterized protein n=1 Tax=Rhizodiscina lignyota TaxID=1504668 RepID=A0A9P4IH70_9PEZI|nr:hypothetical protein NA57DRAFT_55534 [Rhizodiscina lignyota]